MYFPLPVPGLEFDLEETAGAIGQEYQGAYGRYVEGVNTIVRSLDVPVGLTPKEVVWELNKSKLF